MRKLRNKYDILYAMLKALHRGPKLETDINRYSMLRWNAYKRHLKFMLKGGFAEDDGQDIRITEKESKYVELMNSVKQLFGDDGKEEGDEDENLESF